MSSALEKLRERAARTTGVDNPDIRVRRGVVATTSAQIPADADDDAPPDQVDLALKPGQLPPRMAQMVVVQQVPGDLQPLAPDEGGEAAGSSDMQAAAPAQPTAVDRLRERARLTQAEDTSFVSYKKDMAALRALGGLMEAVYVRPGNSSPVTRRMQALLTLTQTSREMAQALLHAVGDTQDSGYTRAVAMDAVVGIVGRCWEDARDDEQFLSNKPLELLRQAAVNPQVFEAARDLSRKTWNPVTSVAQHEETLMMASHRMYWNLYTLGEHVVGMDAARCEHAVSRFLIFLQEYPHPRGSSPEMRSNWLSASMGRLGSLACAEIKARFAVSQEQMHSARPVTSDDLNECVELAIEGFENVERHAQKLLGGAFVERLTADRQTVGDSAADAERAAALR